MTEAELEAYSALLQFMERHNPYITLGSGDAGSNQISFKCGLYVAGTFAIASLAAGECAATLGLGCLAGVAGTYMAWDATVAECGL